MLLRNAFTKPKAAFSIFAALTLLNTVMLCQAATQSPDPANIPRAEPVKQLPSAPPADIKQQQKPPQQPSAAGADVKLIVHTFVFSGNKSFTSEQLGALLTDYAQREIGLKDLHEAVKIITDHYRKNGFFLAQAYLPAQDINENKVEISVLEGTLGELRFKAAGALDNKFTAQMARYNLRPGDSVTENNLVRNIALLNSLPALKASAQLNPGQAIGSTDVEIELQPLPRWVGFASVNTYGNRYTGREVAQAGISLNNLANVGDQLIFNLKSSRNEGQRGLQLVYYVPVHVSGTLLNLAYNYVDYKLGGEFKVLNAFGDSQYFNIGIDQPLARNAHYGLTARLGGSHKAINDEVSASALKNQRDISGFDLGLLGDWFDNSNDSNYQLGLNLRAGQVKFKDDYARSLDATDAKTEGNFIKYSLAASRVQYFNNGYSLALRADYQAANKNLDSVEKITIGGANRWRAFSELPSLADAGFMAGADIRKNIPAGEKMASILLETLSPYVFIDCGKGKVNQNALSNDNHVKSIHYGLGLDAAFRQKWLLSLVASHQQQDADGARVNNETRVWGQLQKEF
jgi:hemolysin activation/secretion protein